MPVNPVAEATDSLDENSAAAVLINTIGAVNSEPINIIIIVGKSLNFLLKYSIL